MQYRCSDLGIDDIHLRRSLLSSRVQPVLHMGVKPGAWDVQVAGSACPRVHHMFMKRTF